MSNKDGFFLSKPFLHRHAAIKVVHTVSRGQYPVVGFRQEGVCPEDMEFQGFNQLGSCSSLGLHTPFQDVLDDPPLTIGFH